MSVNKAILVGNVGKDPEVRYLEGGTAVCNFPLATSETYKNKDGEKVSSTEWHNVVLWRGLAEIAEKYVRKGSQLYIEGRIRTRSWDDRDGNKRYTTEIVGDSMQMLGKKTDESSGFQSAQEPRDQQSRQQQPEPQEKQPEPQEKQPEPQEPTLRENNTAGNAPEETDDLPF